MPKTKKAEKVETEDTKVEDKKVIKEEAKEEVGNFTVFYRELTASGRDGATASKRFDTRKKADAFAEAVGGNVR